MLKCNISTSHGYANGTQGRMVGILHDKNYKLPRGKPGEIIMIKPPEYIMMEVLDKMQKTISIVPCVKARSKIDYKKKGKDKTYRCFSNNVVLKFALTIHEVQGQTLDIAILLLGRYHGYKIGNITWSLLYVALSRTKKLSHMKLFPCDTKGVYQALFYKHLLKLSMPSNLKK